MADANTATDKSFEDKAPQQNVTPNGDDKKTNDSGKAADKAPKTEPKKNDEKKSTQAPKKDSEKKPTKSTEKVDKSFQDDKKKVNKNIKVGDRVSYPYSEGEHGKRTSKVYAVDEDTVTVLGYDGQRMTVSKERVEVV